MLSKKIFPKESKCVRLIEEQKISIKDVIMKYDTQNILIGLAIEQSPLDITDKDLVIIIRELISSPKTHVYYPWLYRQLIKNLFGISMSNKDFISVKTTLYDCHFYFRWSGFNPKLYDIEILDYILFKIDSYMHIAHYYKRTVRVLLDEYLLVYLPRVLHPICCDYLDLQSPVFV